MTLRRITPYFFTIAAFLIIYWLTMIIPNRQLFLGYGSESKEVLDNNKIPLQLYIFNYGLVLCMVAINALEIISTQHDRFWHRLLKSLLTIILIYLLTKLIFRLLDTRVFNMHYYPRGTPANLWCTVTLIITSIGLVILEGFKKIYLQRFKKSAICRYIPGWLRFEKLEEL